MDYVDGTFTYESGPVASADFPQTEEPVYILGKAYSALHDREELHRDFVSRLWMTYRRNFPAIGGTGPTGDTGWGCMLRCGQMMLAQTLLVHHCGREWVWADNGHHDDIYWRILSLFQDKKSANYSIQQIASMGVSEGKAVGQWFGPNTVAQVLKKLAVYDDWSNLVIHVAMDNTVIENDIRGLCLDGKDKDSCDIIGCQNVKGAEGGSSHFDKNHKLKGKPGHWKPLLLVIPLRLGLTDINSVYIDSLKRCFTFRQSVGIIGGRPNHAHWFVGFVGDKLVFLDPHTTQGVADLDDPTSSDQSYHCKYPSLMKVTELDPSIAVGFYCRNEEDFTDFCSQARKHITDAKKTPMFEMFQDRPSHWPPYEPYTGLSSSTTGFTEVGTQDDSDEEFELVG
ncbi:cysteine protease ATG4B-like [Ylistrum balloti]|uniref:cysteine protease ATG4B-like n=1 Tax=Ylistrum balloti TaxID=509963 RepID=UPI0029059584|nr:cysteine protease ATG4B-like [Ylistrum balloti]